MEKKDTLKRFFRQSQLKTVQLSIRITPDLSEWLNKEQLSPTAIFEVACEELGYKAL